MNLEAHWTQKARDILRNKTIVNVKYMDGHMYILLDDGTLITPMSDDEGNSPGALHYFNENSEKYGVLPALYS